MVSAASLSAMAWPTALVPISKPLFLKYSHGAIPDHGSGFRNDLGKLPDRHVANVDSLGVLWNLSALFPGLGDLRLGPCFEFPAVAGVGGNVKRGVVAPRGLQDTPSQFERFLFPLGETLPDFVTLGEAEGVGHGAPDDEAVGLFHESLEDLDLVGNLGSPHDHDKGRGRVFQFFDEELQFLFDEKSHGALVDVLGDTDVGSVFAMGCAEGVIDEDITVSGEFFGEVGTVALFLRVVSHILEEQNFAVVESGDGLFRFLANAVSDEADVLLQQLSESCGDRFESEAGADFPVRQSR